MYSDRTVDKEAIEQETALFHSHTPGIIIIYKRIDRLIHGTGRNGVHLQNPATYILTYSRKERQQLIEAN